MRNCPLLQATHINIQVFGFRPGLNRQIFQSCSALLLPASLAGSHPQSWNPQACRRNGRQQIKKVSFHHCFSHPERRQKRKAKGKRCRNEIGYDSTKHHQGGQLCDSHALQLIGGNHYDQQADDHALQRPGQWQKQTHSGGQGRKMEHRQQNDRDRKRSESREHDAGNIVPIANLYQSCFSICPSSKSIHSFVFSMSLWLVQNIYFATSGSLSQQ